ncbi:MAG: diacylglycerol kinase family lipid kinase [Candidatus Azobacteroides sp.]|nr:diacylglycerol kinase family lipid kinase [Candidatus Azobacteroides sp.]
MEKITAIINPVSGTASKKHIPDLLDQYIPSDQFEKQFFFSEYPGHAFELASRAVKENADYVIAVGGDGTVNEVARAMVESPSVLGIVPMGSGNGLARDLAIPMDSRKALEVILERKIKTIDYCKANNRIFFCTCGVGFDASVSERFNKRKNRGPLSYIRSAFTEYLQFKPDTYDIVFENEVLTRKAFLVTCANASQYGNNAYIAPQADIDDGMMDVAILSPFSPLDIGNLVVQMFTKQIAKNHKLQYYRSKKLTLKRAKPGIVHIDGEPVYMNKVISLEVFHNGLNVIVPQDPAPPVYSVASFFSNLSYWWKKTIE